MLEEEIVKEAGATGLIGMRIVILIDSVLVMM